MSRAPNASEIGLIRSENGKELLLTWYICTKYLVSGSPIADPWRSWSGLGLVFAGGDDGARYQKTPHDINMTKQMRFIYKVRELCNIHLSELNLGSLLVTSPLTTAAASSAQLDPFPC